MKDCINEEISSSKTERIKGERSTRVTFFLFLTKASISSILIYPPPIIVIFCDFSIALLILIPSSRVLNVKIFFRPVFFISGINGAAPVAIINLSYSTKLQTPNFKSLTRIFLSAGRIFVT